MSRIIQLRRDASTSWTAVNPTLTQGEFGYETDTNKFKIGNGVDDWNTLGYLFQGEDGGTISYNDLSDLPTLFDGAYSSLTGVPSLATVATSGSYTDLSNTPSLSTVAISGSYTDLSNTPTIPSALTDIGISDGTNGQFLTTDGSGTFSFADPTGRPGGSFEAVASGNLSNGDPVVINSDDSVSSVGEVLSNATKSVIGNNYGDTDEADNPFAGFMVQVPNTTKAILGGQVLMSTANGGNDTRSVVTHLVDVASDGTVTKVSPDYMGHLHACNDTDQSSNLYTSSQSEKPFLAYWDTTHNCLVFGYVRSGSSNDFYFNTATVSGNNITWGTSQKVASVNTALIVNRSASYFRIKATAYNSTDNNAAVFFESNPTGGASSGDVVPFIFSYDGTNLTATEGATAKISDIDGENTQAVHNVAAAWCSWDNNYLLAWNSVVQDSGTKSRIKVASMSATGTIGNVQSHYNDPVEYSYALHRELIADDVANRVLYSYAVEVQPGEIIDTRHYKMLTISSGVVTIPTTASHEVTQFQNDDRNEYRTSMVSSGVYVITRMTVDEPGPYDTYEGYVSWHAYDLLYDGSAFSTRTPANGSTLSTKFNFVNSWGQALYAQAVVNGSVITATGVYGTGQYTNNTIILSYIPGEISSNLTSENYVGISDAAYADGATATIQSAGAVDDAQSGLTAGQAYFLQSDGTLSTTADDPSVFAGVALSSTSILVAKDSVTSEGVSSYNDLTDLPTLFDGAYSSLTGTPTIPSALTDIGISDGADGQVLTTDGSGTFTFQTVSSGSSGATTLNELTDVSTSGVTSGQVLKYNGSSWAPAADSTGTSGISDLVEDTSPQLGGSLDVNGNDIVSTSNGDIDLDPNGSGNVVFKGNSTRGAGAFKLNCENNSHGITIKGPPHSANADYTLTLPNDDGNANQVLTTDGNGELSWSSAGGGAWSLFSSTTITSAVSQIDMSLSSSYNTYMVVVDNLDPCGALYFRWKRGGSFITAGEYSYTETKTSITQRYDQSRFKIAGFTDTNHASAVIYLNNINNTDGPNPSLFSQAVEEGSQCIIAGNNSSNISGAVTDIRLYFDSNPTSGSVYIYRLQTS